MNYRDLTDTELDAEAAKIAAERERRTCLTTYPTRIRIMTDTYIAAGGDPENLSSNG